MKRDSSRRDRHPRIGTRGGTTTWTALGMFRKNFWLSEGMNEALRRKAFEERRSESDILREAVGRLLGVKE